MAGSGPLLGAKPARKRRIVFGYLPLPSECLPYDAITQRVDTTRLLANVVAGCVIGVRQTLSAIVSATLVYTSTTEPHLAAMFPFGIGMMWWSTLVGSAFYAIFGRLQYNTNATQEMCAILYASMAQQAAVRLAAEPARIPPTVVALIATGTVVTGVFSVLLGRLGVGKIMLRFPGPVTSGFLGTIGFFLVKAAMQITSGVQFKYFYPVNFADFVAPRSLAPLACLFTMVFGFMRRGPLLLRRFFPGSAVQKKLGGLICQLAPLIMFYTVVLVMGVSIDTLSEKGWTYPSQSSHDFMDLWTSHRWRDADMQIVLESVPHMGSLAVLSVLCTMTGVLGITGAFSQGPDGDPDPTEVIDFDAELTTVGFGCILAGLTNGVVTFHRLGSSVQLRMDGGTHRIAVLSSAAFVGAWFFSGVPLGHYIPKWFLGGLFMGSGLSFIEGALTSYRSLPHSGLTICGWSPPSPQYAVTVLCLLVAVFSSPFMGIFAGLACSVVLFLWESSTSSPIGSVTTGGRTVSRTMRPPWELQALRREGDRIVVLYLQGQLFFGSGQTLAAKLALASQGGEAHGSGNASRVRYCILSFARVPSIDASAVAQLKAAVKRAAEHGCKVLFCRMNREVFYALSAIQVVTSPDADLRNVLGMEAPVNNQEESGDLIVEPEPISQVCESGAEDNLGLASMSSHFKLKRSHSFRPLGFGDHDAFDHESDALDNCASKLLEEFLYHGGRCSADPLQRPCMAAFWASCAKGVRLDEGPYEEMNHLPSGTLSKLQPFCEVGHFLPGEELPENPPMLHLIFQGAVALVDIRPVRADSCPSVADELGTAMKGFHGRDEKRLRKRYPPGFIVGQTTFFLQPVGDLVDVDVVPRLVASSKLGYRTEIWSLGLDAWGKLPGDLRECMTGLLLREMAEERQHTFLSGE